MPHFTNPQNKLFWLDAGVDPAVWLAPDCVQITDEQADALRAPNMADLIAAKTDQLRAAREVILNRLAGIALAAQLTGDTATTAAYVTVRQWLLDITADLPSDETVDALVMYRYAELVAACTPQMVAAFAQVDQ